MKVELQVACAAVREALRAIALPVHIALHGLTRAHWRRRIREALAADPAAARGGASLDAFLRAHPPARAGHVFVSAGEPSGERHAANLVAAVRRAGAAPRVSAFGGELLRAAGADVLYPLAEHAVMGVIGVFSSLPFVLRAHRRYLELLRDDPPSVVVLVDYPGLHLVMARAARRLGIPVIHYIAPQYWAWGPWRMKRYRRAVDATLTILPFEAEFFVREGIPSAYVGHPLLDQLANERGVADTGSAQLLCIMPGSRGKELRLHLPALVRIARSLRAQRPGLRVVLPYRNKKREPMLRAMLTACEGEFVELAIGDTTPWLRAARAVIVKSGTGSLEAVLCGAPSVVVYAIHGPLFRWGMPWLLNVPWFSAANLIAAREIVPELAIESDADWDRAEQAAALLLDDTPERARALEGIAEVRSRLGAPGASDRAACWVLPYSGGRRA